MFTKLLELNRILERKNPRSTLDRLNQGLPESYRHGIAICFDRDTGTYEGLRLIQGSAKVIYKEASSSNGFSPTGVQKLTEDPRKTVVKLKRCLNELSTVTSEIREEIKRAVTTFDEEVVQTDVCAKVEEIKPDQNNRGYLFLAFVHDAKLQPFYNETEIQEYLVKTAFDEYGLNGKSIQCDMVCYACGEPGKRVYGNFSRLKTYNLDKPGVITGGFLPSSTVKNFPVCEDCITAISSAYEYAKKKLTFGICGERYLLLPCLRTNEAELAEIIVDKIEEMGDSTAVNQYEKITAAQNEILDELAAIGKGKDLLTLSFIFFEEANASWKITGEIPEVLPSRVFELYEAKKTIEADHYLKLGGDKPFWFTFRIIRDFAGNSGKPSQRKFMAYLDAVFSGRTIREEVLLADIVRTITATSKGDPQMLPFVVRNALATWAFLARLNTLEKGARRMSEEISVKGGYGRFLSGHADFFDRQEKIVAFLTGCYVSKVLFVQSQNLGSSPFYKKLRGMKLDRKRLQVIFPDARNKIQQYDAFGLVHELDPLVADAWVLCGDKWEISDDEATLAFTIGLSLDYAINKTEKEVKQ